MTNKPDGRSKASRRVNRLIAALSEECGGAENLSMAERELVRASALAVMRVRALQDQIILGDSEIDDALVCRLLNAANRTLSAVAAKSRKRGKREMSLDEYLKGTSE